MINSHAIPRREFVLGSLAAAVAIPTVVSGQTPVASPTAIRDFLPAGMLESAAVAPEYETYVTHSTLQVASSTIDDSCTMKVYPNARRTTSAVSVLMRSTDLERSPNQFLVQKVVYRDAALASSEFRFMAQEVVDVIAGMLIRQPQYAATDSPEEQRRRFEYMEPNDFNYALHIELVGAEIHVVRAGGFGDPDWDLVDERVQWLAETDLDSLQRLEAHGDWVVSYGPIDFHPDAYQAPDCFGP